MALSALETPTQAEVTTSSSTFYRFLELPIEIRFMIYKELMVRSLDLRRVRCPSCPERTDDLCGPINLPSYMACTRILRTSKQIYTEILPILYSKKTIHVKCSTCERRPHFDVWACRAEPHAVSAGRIEHYSRHVKNIMIASNIRPFRFLNRIKEFADYWPTIEDKLLARYENTEHISLQMRSFAWYDSTFELVRRSSEPTTEHVHNYRSVLAQQNMYNYYGRLIDRAVLEETCDSILLSHALGKLKDTAFAVQSIHWKPQKSKLKPFVLYLGCDKHHASDTLIEQILAKREVLRREAAI